MNILHKVTRKSMMKNRTRTVVTVIGIILSTAMFTAVTTMAVSLWDYLVRGAIATSGNYHAEFAYVTDEEYDTIRADSDITHTADYRALGYYAYGEESWEKFIVGSGDEALFETVSFYMKEGRLPRNDTEAVITEDIQKILQEQGKPCTVGSLLQLEVQMEADYGDIPEVSVGAEPFTVTYTIVGIYVDYVLDWKAFDSVLTTQAKEPALWHRVFVRTDPMKAVYDMEYGQSLDVNSDLLGMYGITLYSNYNSVILSFAVILSLIILTGSVSLIYNAFSISVSERMKQYGLLSGIGATGKQLRGSVYYEAGLLCAIAIPFGLFFGWLGIAVTLHLLQGNIQDLIAYNEQITITLYAVPSPVSFLAAGLIAVGTVYISAFIPAVRATRVSPMHAIRQQSDYKVPPRAAKTSRLIWKAFGLPGAMARKYYKVSRKKYRATVISLTISVILFVSAATFGSSLRTVVAGNVATQNYDMRFWSGNTDVDLEAVRSSPYVAKSAWWSAFAFRAVVTGEEMTQRAHEVSVELAEDYDQPPYLKNVSVYYLEDTHLEQFLKDMGEDPAPYLDPQDPKAVVCRQNVVRYEMKENGEHTRYTDSFEPFAPGAQTITLVQSDRSPDGLADYISSEYQVNGWSTEYYLTEDMEMGLRVVMGLRFDHETQSEQVEETVCFVIRQDDAGVPGYHLVDPDTGAVADAPMFTDNAPATVVSLGECFNEIPYGLSSSILTSAGAGDIKLILPLSAMPENDWQPTLSLSVSDYNGLKAFLKAEGIDKGYYDDLLEEEQVYRSLILMVDVFSYGFIVLISAICVANVFNTVSTNIALRRRDFGMLRSVGMKMSEVYRMLSLECLTYGVKSLVWGLPVSLLFSLYMYSVIDETGTAAYSPPVSAMGIATACVFVVVFASMAYSVAKVRKESPMDAIRMENI